MLGFYVNSFDCPPQIGAVGPVVYALNEFSPLFSFVIRCSFGDLIIHCRSRVPACVGRLAPPSWSGSPLGLVCIAYVFQWETAFNSVARNNFASLWQSVGS